MTVLESGASALEKSVVHLRVQDAMPATKADHYSYSRLNRYATCPLADARRRGIRATRRDRGAHRGGAIRLGRGTFVPLSEIEARVPPLWESIKAAETLRRNS